MGLSSPGIGSNLDVNGIVSQLMAVEGRRMTKLQTEEASFQAKLSAFGQVKSAFASFQSAVSSLSTVQQFQATTAVASDAAKMTASATSVATPGAYSLEVTKLAQAQKLATAGQASSTAAVGSGTVTIDFGKITGGAKDASGKYTGAAFESNGSGAKTITIDPSNNSLSGIRDAINTANVGVTATIVNDGSASPYRLVLTNKATGEANSMKLSVAGDASLAGLLSHDPAADPVGQSLTETIKAQNAEFTIDGLAVSKPSNTVTDAIPGVTLNLLAKTAADTPATVTVARDTAAVVSSVNKFVSAFNAINKTLTDSSKYDPATQSAAVLNGDSAIRSAQAGLRSVLASAVQGGYGKFDRLSEVGVSFQKDGSLALDTAKLNKALESNFTDVAGLFASAGRASDSLVSYTSSSPATKPGNYGVTVTQLATQASITGVSAAGLSIVAGTNDEISVTLNGLTGTVKLKEGTYANAGALATEVQSKINGNAAFIGSSVKVAQVDGKISITSEAYGTDSSVSVAGAGSNNLFGGGTNLVRGLDVAGTINGAVATGRGQALAGAAKDNSDGLQVMITGGVLGARGTINFSRGYATQFNDYVNNLTGTSGSLSSRTEGLNTSIAALKKQQAAESARLSARETALRAQFTALDSKLSGLTSTSNYLAQQLEQISALSVR